MTLECCYFCGFADDTALSKHHIIPKRVQGDDVFDDRTVTLCRNCHKKAHDIIDPIVDEHVNLSGDDGELDSEKVVWGMKVNRPLTPEDQIIQLVGDVEDEYDNGAPVDVVKDIFGGDGEAAEDAIESACHKGNIYRPTANHIRTV